MKKFIVAIIATAALVAPVLAQDAGPKGFKPGERQEGKGRRMMGMRKMQQEMLAKLNLTPQQKQKVEALQKQTQEKMKALMTSAGDQQAKMEKMRQIRTDSRKQMEAILTPAQKAQLKKLMEEARKKMMERRKNDPNFRKGGGKGAPPSPKPGK